MKTIYLAADHGGFALKEKLKAYLMHKGIHIKDLGASFYNPQDDYPDYAIPLGKEIVKAHTLGIVACRNGQGVCIAANKVRGVRAVTGFSVAEVRMARLHDKANILSLPANYLSWEKARSLVHTFLQTKFSHGIRHQRRLRKIARYEHG